MEQQNEKQNKNCGKLLMLKGLPASGKSTYARELVKNGWKRVNKDDLRAMIDGGQWSRDNESMIKDTEQTIAMNYLTEGYDVVVDDTNFVHQNFWKQTAETCKVDFEVKFFDVPLMECIERDSKRGDKSVGAKVIYRMYEQYLKPPEPTYDPKLPECYIFDIDGTLAHTTSRSPYDYSKVMTDRKDDKVAAVLKKLATKDNFIFILSGREGVCREDTIEWLKDNEIVYDGLFMREAGDKRKDYIIKKELYENNIKGRCNVMGVFDDRNQVVDLWRSLGLKCFQVEYGYF